MESLPRGPHVSLIGSTLQTTYSHLQLGMSKGARWERFEFSMVATVYILA